MSLEREDSGRPTPSVRDGRWVMSEEICNTVAVQRQ